MSTTQNGKGDKPRNCFSTQFRNNYADIIWSKPKPIKQAKLPTEVEDDIHCSDDELTN